MTPLNADTGEAWATLRMDGDTLQALPFSERMRAYADFETACASWQLARWHRRVRPMGWALDASLDMRRALRSWRHYANAVRKAKRGRLAA